MFAQAVLSKQCLLVIHSITDNPARHKVVSLGLNVCCYMNNQKPYILWSSAGFHEKTSRKSPGCLQS